MIGAIKRLVKPYGLLDYWGDWTLEDQGFSAKTVDHKQMLWKTWLGRTSSLSGRVQEFVKRNLGSSIGRHT